MNYFMTLAGCAFDMFIIIIFMNGIFVKKRSIPAYLFYGCFIVTELILYINDIIVSGLPSSISTLITSLISLTTTILLTFFYESSLLRRIFLSLSFQVFASFGEYFFTLIIQFVHPETFQMEYTSLRLFMSFGAKIILFLLCLIYINIWNAKFSKKPAGYNLLLFSTPIISIIIMISIPLKEIVIYNNQNFPMIIYTLLTALAVLNITNYIFLSISFKRAETDYRIKQLEQQINFQNEKYLQLSTVYRTNKSIIHDVKKHYFTVKEFVKNNEYDRLVEYLNLSINDMERTYTDIHTGNLVIDSIVSNYKTVSNDNSIVFTESICADPARIPVADYDLCVILGNILDNSLNACMKNTDMQNKIDLEISVNLNDTFLIYIANTYDPKQQIDPDDSYYEHGYGLENVRRIVERHHGMMRVVTSDSEAPLFEVTIIIPIIDPKQRFRKISS